MKIKNSPDLVSIVLTVFLAGCSGQSPVTVSEVIQNAQALEGKTIRVRGQAYLWIDPSREEMWMIGGCAINPDGTLIKQGNVTGWLTLYEKIDPDDLRLYGAPHDDQGIKISEDSFHCIGNYCTMTCSSFEAVSQQVYEFVGVLRIDRGSELVLENIDLNQSSQFVDGNWMPIQEGDFGLMFP